MTGRNFPFNFRRMTIDNFARIFWLNLVPFPYQRALCLFLTTLFSILLISSSRQFNFGANRCRHCWKRDERSVTRWDTTGIVENVIKGIDRKGLPKIRVAEDISEFMPIDFNFRLCVPKP